MNAPNVKLSANELNLVVDSHFILTKKGIINKVIELMGALSEEYKAIITDETKLPDEIRNSNAKIAKGENYEHLPWVILDYPRVFLKEDIFVIRTFFLWGNYFSITIQLQGIYKEQFKHIITEADKDNSCYPWYLCLNEDKWQHHFREDNYRLLQSEDAEQMNDYAFIKLAKKIPLQEWDNVYSFLVTTFNQISTVLILST